MKNKDVLVRGADAASKFSKLDVIIKKTLPIRPSEFGLLLLVIKSEVPVTPVVASNYFQVSKPMVTGLVNSMVSGGYLKKHYSSDDKRSYDLVAEKKAHNLVKKMYAEYDKELKKVIDVIGEERYQTLVESLEEVNEILGLL